MMQTTNAGRVRIAHHDEHTTEIRSVWMPSRTTRSEYQIRLCATADRLEIQTRTRRGQSAPRGWATTQSLGADEMPSLGRSDAETRLLGALLIAAFEVSCTARCGHAEEERVPAHP